MRKRVLGAEDSRHLRELFKRFLEKAGYDCEVAENGRQAREFLDQGEPFDMIVSDYEMPELNGLQFLTWVRSNSRFDHIPFVLVSAKTTISEEDLTPLEKKCAEFKNTYFRSKLGLVYHFLVNEFLGGPSTGNDAA